MPRDAIYFRDFKSKGWRYRLMMIPAAGTTLSSTTTPAYNATPTYGSGNIYIKLPRNVLKNTVTSECGFDKLPIGLVQTPTLKIGVNLSALDSTAALQDFRSYILQPRYLMGPITSNVWTLLSDFGVSSRSIGSFVAIGQYAQQPLPSQRFKSNKKLKRTQTELECVHIIRAVLEGVTPQVWANDVLLASYTTKGGYQYTVDTHWVASSHTYQRREVSPDGSGGNAYAHLWRLVDVFKSLESVADTLYTAYIRQAGAFQLNGFASGGGLSGTAFDALTFYKYDYTAAGTRGASLARTALYVIGQISDNATVNTGTYFGGWLHNIGKDPGGLFKYRNAWDMLKDCCENGHIKGCIVQGATYAPTIFFAREKEQPYGSACPLPEIIGADSDFEVGGNVIVGAQAQIPGAGSEDVADVSVRSNRFGILSEEERNVAIVLHNNPNGGDNGNRAYYGHNDGGCYVQSNGFILERLYYIDTQSNGSGGTAESPFRVHHSVVLDDGVTTHDDCANGIALPTPATFSAGDDTGDPPVMETGFFVPLQGAYVTMQQEAGVGFAVCDRLVKAFSGETQTLYDIEAPITAGGIADVGNQVDSADFPDASILQGDGTYLDIYPGAPWIISQEMDIKTGHAKMKMLGVA